jgi:N-acetyl-alpha-D-muramate 1-phosphate uridylyltransferase
MPAAFARQAVIGMILAAGRGERMRPLTDRRPKALLEVGGKCLIDWQLERLRNAGVVTVVVNLGWLGDRIVGHVGDGSRHGLQVVYSPEDERILETGGGIHRALPMLGKQPFWAVNADVFTDLPLPAVELPANDLAHLVLVPTPSYRRSGDFDLEDGRVRRGSSLQFTFSGMGFYRPEMFADCEPGRFPLAPMLFRAATENRLQGEIYGGTWEDVGTVERLEALNRRRADAGA